MSIHVLECHVAIYGASGQQAGCPAGTRPVPRRESRDKWLLREALIHPSVLPICALGSPQSGVGLTQLVISGHLDPAKPLSSAARAKVTGSEVTPTISSSLRSLLQIPDF